MFYYSHFIAINKYVKAIRTVLGTRLVLQSVNIIIIQHYYLLYLISIKPIK